MINIKQKKTMNKKGFQTRGFLIAGLLFTAVIIFFVIGSNLSNIVLIEPGISILFAYAVFTSLPFGSLAIGSLPVVNVLKSNNNFITSEKLSWI